MLNLFSTAGRQEPLETFELPCVMALGDSAQRDWALVLGGLALVLSRCSSRAVDRDFSATAQAYHALHRQLRPNVTVCVSPRLLNDVSQEIAGCADAITRHALARCMLRVLELGQTTARPMQHALPGHRQVSWPGSPASSC